MSKPQPVSATVKTRASSSYWTSRETAPVSVNFTPLATSWIRMRFRASPSAETWTSAPVSGPLRTIGRSPIRSAHSVSTSSHRVRTDRGDDWGVKPPPSSCEKSSRVVMRRVTSAPAWATVSSALWAASGRACPRSSSSGARTLFSGVRSSWLRLARKRDLAASAAAAASRARTRAETSKFISSRPPIAPSASRQGMTAHSNHMSTRAERTGPSLLIASPARARA